MRFTFPDLTSSSDRLDGPFIATALERSIATETLTTQTLARIARAAKAQG